MKSAHAYIALGSNLGDRQQHLRQAARLLLQERRVSLVAAASLYETEPLLAVGQRSIDVGDYLNTVIHIETTLAACQLMDFMLTLEHLMGRRRRLRWAPRVIDLDLLQVDQELLVTDWLTLPHPAMHERPFVMVPLNELAPDLVHPVFNRTVAELLVPLHSDLSPRKLESSWF